MPDSWEKHVKLMFDLQALAFAGDITRVTSFKLSRDATGRAFPESGVNGGFHGSVASWKHERAARRSIHDRIEKISRRHFMTYFYDKLKKPAGQATAAAC